MKKRASFRSRVSALLLVLFAAAFLLPASRTGDSGLYTLAAAVPGMMLLLLFLPLCFPSPYPPFPREQRMVSAQQQPSPA